VPITRLPEQLPRARAVQDALAVLVERIDEAKAAGLTIPPVAAVGVANIGVSLVAIAGSEAQQAGLGSPFSSAHGPAILASITPSPIPHAFTRALSE
jgi:hypothetical protein